MSRFRLGRVLSLCLVGGTLGVRAIAQPALRFKTRDIQTEASSSSLAALDSPVPFGRGHLVIQFNQAPGPEIVRALAERGVAVLGDIPDNAFLVAVDRPV